MIKSITIKNFKSFADAELKLSSPFTVLVGANASGKSNLIRAVRTLAMSSFLKDIKDIRSRLDFLRAEPEDPMEEFLIRL